MIGEEVAEVIDSPSFPWGERRSNHGAHWELSELSEPESFRSLGADKPRLSWSNSAAGILRSMQPQSRQI